MTKILIVDDSAFLRRILGDFFSHKRCAGPLALGCSLVEAASTADALRIVQTQQLDLVLLDIVMDRSERDGIEILMEIMRTPSAPAVIMMSAVGQERIINECLSLGAVGYVFKPFDEAQLLATVEGALIGRQQDATLQAAHGSEH